MACSRYHAGSELFLLLALSLFCTFARCTVLRLFSRSGNTLTLRCVSDLQNQFEVPNAIFFVRTPDGSRQPVRNFTRGQRSHEIMFTLTPETEGNFSCQNPTTNEFSEELLLAAYPGRGRSPQTQYVYILTGETAQLNCSTQPGRARTLYSVGWNRNNIQIVSTTFSLPVAVQNVSQNGTVYQCTVTVQSCSPVSPGRCATASQTAVGDHIALVVGVPLTFIQNVQSLHVTMGNHANFTCRARGTNITLYWEILGVGVYHDCTDEAFCVRITSAVNSVSSTLEIDVTQPSGTEISVHCVVEQTFGGRTHQSIISTGQLTVQDVPPDVSCEAETTGFLSWPDTPAGTTRTLRCPSTTAMISRTCSPLGVWENVDTSLCTSFASINTDNITPDNYEEILVSLSEAVSGAAINDQVQTTSNLAVVAAAFLRSAALISERTIILNETVQNLINILEGLLQWNEDVLQANASNIVRSFDVIVGVFAQQLVEGGSYSFMTENVLFVAELLSQAELVATGRSFSSDGQTGNTNINTLNVCETAAVFLPASLFQLVTNNNVGISYTVYDTGALFPITNATEILRETNASVTTVVGTPVLAVTVGAGLNFNGLVDPVRILLRLKDLENVTNGPPRCVSWDIGLEEWTTEGCQTIEVNESVVICNCNHLTNFAVLVDVCSRFAMLDIDECSVGARYRRHDATCNNSQAPPPGTIAGIGIIVGTITGLVLIAGFFFIVFLLRKLISGRFLKHESPAVPLSVAQIRLHGNIEYKEVQRTSTP